MGHLHLLLDEMGLDEMGLDEMGINLSIATKKNSCFSLHVRLVIKTTMPA